MPTPRPLILHTLCLSLSLSSLPSGEEGNDSSSSIRSFGVWFHPCIYPYTPRAGLLPPHCHRRLCLLSNTKETVYFLHPPTIMSHNNQQYLPASVPPPQGTYIHIYTYSEDRPLPLSAPSPSLPPHPPTPISYNNQQNPPVGVPPHPETYIYIYILRRQASSTFIVIAVSASFPTQLFAPASTDTNELQQQAVPARRRTSSPGSLCPPPFLCYFFFLVLFAS